MEQLMVVTRRGAIEVFDIEEVRRSLAAAFQEHAAQSAGDDAAENAQNPASPSRFDATVDRIADDVCAALHNRSIAYVGAQELEMRVALALLWAREITALRQFLRLQKQHWLEPHDLELEFDWAPRACAQRNSAFGNDGLEHPCGGGKPGT